MEYQIDNTSILMYRQYNDMKNKGQRDLVAKLVPLALFVSIGGLAEWSNAADCKSVNGADTTVRGFESLTRLKINSPAKALTSAREINCTAEAIQVCKLSIWLLAVELKRSFHSDLPQLPDRCAKTWETSQRTPALPLFAMR